MTDAQEPKNPQETGGAEAANAGRLPSKSGAELAPGDRLVLYSDGLPEALDRGGEAFGFERIRQLVEEGGTPREIHDRILREFDVHVAGKTIVDDLTLVVVGRDR